MGKLTRNQTAAIVAMLTANEAYLKTVTKTLQRVLATQASESGADPMKVQNAINVQTLFARGVGKFQALAEAAVNDRLVDPEPVVAQALRELTEIAEQTISTVDGYQADAAAARRKFQ